MFDIGFWELIFIFGLALLILGPEKLPRVASRLGHWAGRARAMVRSLRIQMEQELALDKVRDLEKSRPQPPNTVAVDDMDDAAAGHNAAQKAAASGTDENSEPDSDEHH